MGQATVVYLFENLDSPHSPVQSSWPRNQAGPVVHAIPRSNTRCCGLSRDQRLVEDVFLLFDSAADHFDEQEDYEKLELIDQLAVEVMSRIHNYIRERERLLATRTIDFHAELSVTSERSS